MFCSKCGKSLEPGTKFCNSCGAPVNQENNNVETPQMGVENNMATAPQEPSVAPAPTMAGPASTPEPTNMAPMGNPEPKKNNALIIIVVVLVLIIGGLLAYFLLTKDKGDDNNTQPTTNNTPTDNNKPTDPVGPPENPTTQANTVTIDNYEMPIPSGFEVKEQGGKKLFANANNDLWFTVDFIQYANYNRIVNNADNIKEALSANGIIITNDTSKTISGLKTYVFEASYSGYNAAYAYVELNSSTVVQFSIVASTMGYDEMENKVVPYVKTITYKGSASFAASDVKENEKIETDFYKFEFNK